MKIHDFKGEIRITQTDVPGSYSLGDVRRVSVMFINLHLFVLADH